ncbi:MAG: FkbM family methyltransferase [Nanohaloarchaea archaeon]|nr:FkbM family methyltransferase [Candidatus Nanohaloarchaea archaeon]
MIKRYSKKVLKLVKNPGKIRYVASFLKQEFTLRKGRKTTEINEISCNFTITSPTEYNRVKNFKDEKPVIKSIIEELDESDTFYDIGANIGTHACFAGKTGAKVYGFEPFPKNAEHLRRNFELNSINGKVFEVALMNQNSEMMLKEESGEAGEGEASISNQGDMSTETWKGDDFISEHEIEQPDVIKIDVEGAELEVLKGLEKTLETANTLFIELHGDRIKKFGGSEAELKKFLKDKEFKLYDVGSRESENHIKVKR